ncbi:hypothetical protein [Mycobacterium marinum]|uniref:hypothetical protein n=1 Tax=Mycobacterium marinum TaxID=1781 RepID=UPI001594EA5F|nr:hypothetical protein [Mycobacterium marinum]
MIVVHLVGGETREYPQAARFLTEEVFNNLCVHGEQDELLAVWAQDQWRGVEVVVDSGG